jgi:hypothetical protein
MSNTLHTKHAEAPLLHGSNLKHDWCQMHTRRDADVHAAIGKLVDECHAK